MKRISSFYISIDNLLEKSDPRNEMDPKYIVVADEGDQLPCPACELLGLSCLLVSVDVHQSVPKWKRRVFLPLMDCRRLTFDKSRTSILSSLYQMLNSHISSLNLVLARFTSRDMF